MELTPHPALQGASRRLAAYCSGLRLDDVPVAVVRHVKTLVLDAIGCCLQGSTLPWTRHVAELAIDEGSRPVASLIGRREQVSAAQAALVNATAGHAFEMDDIHRDAIIHGGSIVVPVALALGESIGSVSGERFLESIIAGYELGARIGAGASQSLLLKGFHPQGTTGSIAAGAAGARMLALDPVQTLHALGTAASQGAGLMAAQEGAMVKRFHSGRAAQSGVYAALLARRGFSGIEEFVEAPYGGFISAFSDDPQPERVLDGLGERFETAAVGFKVFAAVTSIHTCLEALQKIMQDTGIDADGILSVDAYISEPTYLHCAWPYTGQSVTAAQMNLFYGLAVMAIDGTASVPQYSEARIRDPQISEFMKRITAHNDIAINALGPAHRHTAKLIVQTTDGRRFEQRVEQRKGSPQNPLTYEEVVAKFRHNAASILNHERMDALIQLVDTLDALDDIKPLVALLNTAGNATSCTSGMYTA